MIRTASIYALALCAGGAFAGGGGNPSIGDLDNNGFDETQASYLRRTIVNPGEGGTVSFRFAFMTGEAHDTTTFHDVFRVRLLDITRGTTIAEFGGAVGTEATYSGDFEMFDFSSPDVEGELVAPGSGFVSGQGHSYEEGLIGWGDFTFDLGNSRGEPLNQLALEFLVADSDDTAVESALAIDDVVIRTAAGAPIDLANGGFEDGLGDWELDGEGGVFTTLFHREGGDGGDPVGGGGVLTPAFFAFEGENFALITSNIPAPGATPLVALAALAGLRRRR